MYCSDCGKEISKDNQFCKYCGKSTNNYMLSNSSNETNSGNIIKLKHICIGVIILLLIIIGIQAYYINNKKDIVIKNEQYTSTSDNTKNSVSNEDISKNNTTSSNSQLTGIEQAIQDGMIGENYITEGVTEDTLSFAYTEGNLQMYYDSWENCIEDAKKLNIIKEYDYMYEFPSSITTFPIEVGDTVKTLDRQYFRKEPSYNSEITNSGVKTTTVIEVKDNWANTYLGWIPIEHLEGEKPAEIEIIPSKFPNSRYIEVEKDYYITDSIKFYLSQKNGTLTEALKNMNDILNFEFEQRNYRTCISGISGVPNLKGLYNNEGYIWVVKDLTGEVLEDLDEIDISRYNFFKIEYVPINELKE